MMAELPRADAHDPIRCEVIRNALLAGARTSALVTAAAPDGGPRGAL